MNTPQPPVLSAPPLVHIEANELESGTVVTAVADSVGGAIDDRSSRDAFALPPSALVAEGNGDIFRESGTADGNLPMETLLDALVEGGPSARSLIIIGNGVQDAA